MTDMEATVSVRQLQRETSAVLHEIEAQHRSIIVTRNGEEIAKIVPLSPAERLWRAWVRENGGDPDDPRLRRDKNARPFPGTGMPLSRALAELRENER
jgi:prevent-host-death family protein